MSRGRPGGARRGSGTCGGGGRARRYSGRGAVDLVGRVARLQADHVGESLVELSIDAAELGEDDASDA